MALAYFITFTTYGTRLHGNENGSVDVEHNAHETPFVEPDPRREKEARSAMTQPAYVMGAAERQVVCEAIVQLAKERGWDLLAAHVRTTHVHVVVCAERDPGRLMSDLKQQPARKLERLVCLV